MDSSATNLIRSGVWIAAAALVLSTLALAAPTAAGAAELSGAGAASAVLTDTDAGEPAADPEPPAEPESLVNQTPPTIAGTLRVGATLTADPGSWGGSPTTFTYQWSASGATISGATAQKLTLKPAQLGATIAVTVTAAKDGAESVSVSSASTGKVATGTLTTATPKISGKLGVNSTLTAKPGKWTSGTAFTYQWYANGKAISKATKSTLKLGKAQQSKRITVRVTGKKTAYSTVAKTSAASLKVAKAPRPTITGDKQVGKKLKAVPGAWLKGTRFTYQWYANDKPIAKATSSKLKITKTLKNKAITVRVTGRKAGYATVTKASLGRTTRWVEVDLSSQRLYMHENGKVVATSLVSTGTKAHPTKKGTFVVRAKLVKQNMGCVPSVDYCTKNVPWVMYFHGDQALHGAYWHHNFGHVMSHGCVNLPVSFAKKLYSWAKVGTTVEVHG